MLQLTLGLFFERDYCPEDFMVTNANVEAYRAIQNPKLWPDKRLLIIGEEGSGKTHLTKIFKDSLPDSWLAENIENCDEEELFHLINKAKNEDKYLLLTATNFTTFQLKDLQSRINSTHKVLIKPADEQLLKIILNKHFFDKQIKVKDEVLDYILTHYERNYKAIKTLVNDLDKLALTAKRHITIPLVKSYLFCHNNQTANHGFLL